MKRTLMGLTAASLLIGAPLANAHGGDDRRGGGFRHEHRRDHWHRPTHVHRYYRVPPRVVYYYPAPVVVTPRVYVPFPPAHYVAPRVSIGVRATF